MTTSRLPCTTTDPRTFDPLTALEALYAAGDPYRLPRVRRALTFCHACPARASCLEVGLTEKHQGVWGGHYLSREALRARGIAA